MSQIPCQVETRHAPDIQVHARCKCGTVNVVVFDSEGGSEVGYSRCSCGTVLMVTKPVVGNILGMADYARNLEENEAAAAEYPEG